MIVVSMEPKNVLSSLDRLGPRIGLKGHTTNVEPVKGVGNHFPEQAVIDRVVNKDVPIGEKDRGFRLKPTNMGKDAPDHMKLK